MAWLALLGRYGMLIDPRIADDTAELGGGAANEDGPTGADDSTGAALEDNSAGVDDATGGAIEEDSAGADDATGAAADDGAAEGTAELPDPPLEPSPSRTQPVLSVSTAGHVTCLYSTVGLSAPSKKSSKRKLQPGFSALGKLLQALASETPPY